MNKKGIVVSPPFKPIYTGGVSCGGSPDPIELRKYLMYWDEIDYPSNMLIHISSPEIDYLEQTGKLKRTHVRFQGTINSGQGEFFIQAQEAAFRKNQADEPGCWTIAQLADIPFYTQQSASVGVEVELYDMLPVPSADTPLADILEFKEKRQDELTAFRCHMDEVNENILSSRDVPRARNAQMARVELALKDIDKTLSESGVKRITTNLRNVINADFSGIVGAGLGSAGISTFIGMSPLIAGVAGAGLVLGVKSLIMPSNQCPTDFSYINSIRKNFQ
ncbi:hypothetical protein V6957_004759 [Vibrio parahaemolyticus]|nr:hypothetical protein [Vibrio parahaemolyticus]EGQ8991468.1 hypothetical protein [Vibrio parahaemolyticus]EGQ9010640.1 hypothetical protein [Vibrio parahaemolyticus]EGR2869990.1 hypothetical protein [Vibrio parahaemolyticus]EGR2899719.1 hypothetical protein [Vibrio parahaemolyticus]